MQISTKRISATIAVLAAAAVTATSLGFSAASADAVVVPPKVPPGQRTNPDPAIGDITASHLSVYKNFTIFEAQVDGVVDMTPTDAQKALDLGYHAKCSVYGRDLTSDDLLVGPVFADHTSAAANGLKFQCNVGGTKAQFDEDQPSIFDPYGTDDLVANAELVDPNGVVVRTSKMTNEVDGNF